MQTYDHWMKFMHLAWPRGFFCGWAWTIHKFPPTMFVLLCQAAKNRSPQIPTWILAWNIVGILVLQIPKGLENKFRRLFSQRFANIAASRVHFIEKIERVKPIIPIEVVHIVVAEGSLASVNHATKDGPLVLGFPTETVGAVNRGLFAGNWCLHQHMLRNHLMC